MRPDPEPDPAAAAAPLRSCTAIVGTKSLEHLKQNIAAAERGVLPADVYKLAQEKLASVGIAPGRC